MKIVTKIISLTIEDNYIYIYINKIILNNNKSNQFKSVINKSIYINLLIIIKVALQRSTKKSYNNL